MIIKWLKRADRQRDSQIDRIALDSPQAAIEMDQRVEQQVNQLVGEFPLSGTTGRVPGTRELVISKSKFIVVFRVKPKTERIEIIRFLHSSQLYPPDSL